MKNPLASPMSTKSENSNDDNKPKADGDCPPGMVRGPNGQLWPAWVFCTRYSDRPSSGEFKNEFLDFFCMVE